MEQKLISIGAIILEKQSDYFHFQLKDCVYCLSYGYYWILTDNNYHYVNVCFCVEDIIETLVRIRNGASLLPSKLCIGKIHTSYILPSLPTIFEQSKRKQIRCKNKNPSTKKTKTDSATPNTNTNPKNKKEGLLSIMDTH